MLANFVQETSSNPGTATTINLAGAATGRRSFASAFGSGVLVYYFLDDGTQGEWGIGTVTSGTPNTLARTTVLGNTAGNTNRLNFTGTTRVYCTLPGERTIYTGDDGKLRNAAVGMVVDRAFASYATNADITAVIPFDDTIPQNTEGTQILSASITPKTATNRIRYRFQGFYAVLASANIVFAAFQNSVANAIQVGSTYQITGGAIGQMILEGELAPGSTSAQTIAIRVGPGGATTMRLNGQTSGRLFGGAAAATLVLEEIAA